MQQLIRIFFLALLTGHAFSQAVEGQFIDDVRTTPGCNASVRTSATLANGDVILGGNFTRCGNVRANRVVRFDGNQYFSLGAGAENGVSGRVSAVFVDGEKSTLAATSATPAQSAPITLRCLKMVNGKASAVV